MLKSKLSEVYTVFWSKHVVMVAVVYCCQLLCVIALTHSIITNASITTVSPHLTCTIRGRLSLCMHCVHPNSWLLVYRRQQVVVWIAQKGNLGSWIFWDHGFGTVGSNAHKHAHVYMRLRYAFTEDMFTCLRFLTFWRLGFMSHGEIARYIIFMPLFKFEQSSWWCVLPWQPSLPPVSVIPSVAYH